MRSMHDLSCNYTSGENLNDPDKQDSGRFHSSFVQQMDKPVAAFQPIESNASPARQSVLPNVVVFDLDSVEKRLLAPGKV